MTGHSSGARASRTARYLPPRTIPPGSRATGRDGRIVDYMWDLDGNGTFETDSGTNPRSSHSYRRPSRLNVKVRVRDDDGDTTDATVALINRTDLSLSLKRRQPMGRSVK